MREKDGGYYSLLGNLFLSYMFVVYSLHLISNSTPLFLPPTAKGEIFSGNMHIMVFRYLNVCVCICVYLCMCVPLYDYDRA